MEADEEKMDSGHEEILSEGGQNSAHDEVVRRDFDGNVRLDLSKTPTGHADGTVRQPLPNSKESCIAPNFNHPSRERG
jgi:hypothetical protein